MTLGASGGAQADVSCRIAWADDADAIAGVQVRAWRTSYDGLLPAELLDSLDRDALAAGWRASLVQPADARQRVLVALERNTVTGFALTSPAVDPDADPSSDGEVADLTVDPEHRGHGHALTADAGLRRHPRRGRVHHRGDLGQRRRRRRCAASWSTAGWAPDGAHRELDLRGDGEVTVKQVRLHTAIGMSAQRPPPAIARDGIAIGVASGAYGVSFGAIAVTSGLDLWQTCVLSLLVFTGASQFALVGVLAAGGAPLSGAATGLLLGSRNTLYGLRLAPLLDFRGVRRVAAAHLVIDESTAMAINRETRETRPGRLPLRPAARSSCCGTSPRCSVRSPATGSATPAPTASTRRSAAPSSRCCGHGCETRATGWWPCSAPPWRCAWCRSPRPAFRCSPPAWSRSGWAC